MDSAYEKLLQEISRLVKSQNIVFKGIMKTSESVKLGGIILDTDDLLISEHLKSGWYTKTGEAMQYVEPLKAGDIVLLAKISNEQYAILERLVTP